MELILGLIFLIVIPLIVFLIIASPTLVIGFIAGRSQEKDHYRSLAEREAQYRHIVLLNGKQPPPSVTTSTSFHLVQGAVVISSDHFKTTISAIKKLFGGNLPSYETLLERARREAVLRLKQQAHEQGARLVIGVLFETSMLNQNDGIRNRSKIMCCEVLAYGTALVVSPANSVSPLPPPLPVSASSSPPVLPYP